MTDDSPATAAIAPAREAAAPDAAPRRRSPRAEAWLCGALILAAVALRVVGLGSASFWQDEALCVLNARLPPEQLAAVLAAQNQPPGFHLVLGRWIDFVGSGERAARFFSAIAGLVAVLAVASLAVRLYGAGVRAAALLVGGMSLCWVVWSRDATMYGLFLMLAALQWWLVAEAVFAPGRSRPALWTVIGLLRGAIVWVHYFGFILLVGEALVVAVFAWRRRRAGLLAGFVWSAALTFVAFLPWLGVFLEQRARVASGWWSQSLTLARIVNVPRQWALWLPEVDHAPWNAILIPLGLLPVAWLGGRAAWRLARGMLASGAGPSAAGATGDDPMRRGAAPAPVPALAEALQFAFLATAGQLGAAVVASLESSLMEPKYLLAASIPFTLFFLGGLRAASGRLEPGGRLDLVALACLTVAQLGGYALAVGHPGYRHHDTRAAARWIEEHFAPGDAIVTISTTTLAPLYLYLNAGSRAHPLFMYIGEGEPPPFYEGLGALPRAIYVADADLLAAGQRRLWFVFPTWRERSWEWSDAGERVEADALRGFYRAWGGVEPRPPVARFDRIELHAVPIERTFDFPEVWAMWEAWMARWQADQESSALGRFLRPQGR